MKKREKNGCGARQPQSDRLTVVAWIRIEDLVLLRHGLLDVGEPEDVRRSVPVVDDGSHRAAPPSTVRTTLPVFCSVSTYRVASTTSSSGYERSIDGPVLSGLDQLLDEEDFLPRPPGDAEPHAALAEQLRGEGQEQVLDHQPAQLRRDEDPAGPDRAPALGERVEADGVEDDVVRLAVLRVVALLVVDDLVGAE